MIKLSIIIPCYNAEPYVYELLDCLNKQITDEVEVILIDDGSKVPVKTDYKWCRLYRQKNHGISYSRNRGIKLSSGQILAFVDADDLLADNFCEYIIGRSDEPWDYMDLSWKSLEDSKYMYRLLNDDDSLPNPSASTRVFKRSFIGDTRFNEKKDAAEDEDFTRHLQIRRAKHVCAPDYMYFYRYTTPGSSYKRFLAGRSKTKRIGYFFNTVTKDMTHLIDEFKELDEIHEVMLFTYDNQLPELEPYCQIRTPVPIEVSEIRGEPQRFMKLLPQPIITQVAIYKANIKEFGGIETFIYNFCKHMSEYYDITVVCEEINNNQLQRLVEIVPVVKNNPNTPIECDTLVMNSILENIPQNIGYKQSVQMVHCVKQNGYEIPTKRDHIVHVSRASQESFGIDGSEMIHNLSEGKKTKKALFLCSATRIGANDKLGNDYRCVLFSQMLTKAGIEHIWLYFGDKPLQGATPSMIFCGARQNMKPIIAKADYLVQLSGAEAFSYSLLESLECCTPVIVTPLPQNAEMGIVDGYNGYIVPLNVESFDVKKILNVPKFDFKHDNDAIIERWRKLLGNTKPTRDYQPDKLVEVEVISKYRDIQRDQHMEVGFRCGMRMLRALELQGLGFVRILK